MDKMVHVLNARDVVDGRPQPAVGSCCSPGAYFVKRRKVLGEVNGKSEELDGLMKEAEDLTREAEDLTRETEELKREAQMKDEFIDLLHTKIFDVRDSLNRVKDAFKNYGMVTGEDLGEIHDLLYGDTSFDKIFKDIEEKKAAYERNNPMSSNQS